MTAKRLIHNVYGKDVDNRAARIPRGLRRRCDRWLCGIALALLAAMPAAPALADSQVASASGEEDSASRQQPVTIIRPTADALLSSIPVTLEVGLARHLHPTVFRVLLNGADVSGLFQRVRHEGGAMDTRTASVRPGDGLVPGDNVLTVRVLDAKNTNVTLSQSFSVNATFLKADAGIDLSARPGNTVALDGTNSGGSGLLSAAPISYQWELVSRPSGSNAALSDPSAPVPTITTDKPGLYIARLVVTDGQNVSDADTVSVYALPSPALIALQGTEVATSNGTAISLGGQPYTGESGPGINLITFNRSNLQVTAHTFLTSASSAQSYLQQIISGSQQLGVIMSALDPGFPVSAIASQLQSLGATSEFSGFGRGAFSFIGAQGLKSGEGYQLGSSANLKGYFAQDSQRNYTFTQFDYVTFEIQPAQSLTGKATITIGGHEYTPQAASGSSRGGFHVIVVDRANPSTILSNRTYFTNDSAQGATQIANLTRDLAAYWEDESKLVFVNTFGAAVADPAPLRRVWQELHSIGATYDLLNGLQATDTFAFVGTASPPGQFGLPLYQGPEASTSLGQSGLLKGVLGRGHRGNFYAPVTTSFSDVVDLAMYNIIGQPPATWAFPTDAAEQAAYTWIGTQICSECVGDVRLSYTNSDNPISTIYTNIKTLTCQAGDVGGVKFSATDCEAIQKLWATEISNVMAIQHFQTNLLTLWTDSQSNDGLLLNSAEATVEQAVQPPPQSKAQLIVGLLAKQLIGYGEQAFSSLSGIPLGAVQLAFNIGSILAKQPAGTSATEDVQVEVSKLSASATTAFEQQMAAIGSMFVFILQDGTKIGQLGGDLQSNNGQWTWTPGTTTSQLLTVIDQTERLSYYQSLMATVYAVREMVLYAGQPDPSYYCSETIINSCSFPYSGFPTESYTQTATWVSVCDPYLPACGPRLDTPFLTSLFSDTGTPNQSLLQTLYTTYGVRKIDLLRRWPFQRFYCVEQANTGSGFNGCDVTQYGGQPAHSPLFEEELGADGVGQPPIP